jgi:hypothetical protein
MGPAYADVPTRLKDEGALDKAILMSEIAESLLGDREFNEFVMRKVARAGNAADEQVMEWAKFVEGLPYRRENGEVYRAWREVVGLETGVPAGGDCDDLTILVVAGLRSLGMQSMVEILKDEEGWGFHVRGRVGLPPHRPTYWAIVDPVWKSEREWAMVDRDVSQSPLMQKSSQQERVTQGAQSFFASPQIPWTQRSSTPIPLLALLAVGATAWWLTRR